MKIRKLGVVDLIGFQQKPCDKHSFVFFVGLTKLFVRKTCKITRNCIALSPLIQKSYQFFDGEKTISLVAIILL